MPRKRLGLSLAVSKPLPQTQSFRASPGQFETGDVKIDEEGVWTLVARSCTRVYPPHARPSDSHVLKSSMQRGHIVVVEVHRWLTLCVACGRPWAHARFPTRQV